MAISTVTIGAIAAVYVDGTEIDSSRTGGITITHTVGEEYVDVAGTSVQSGRQELRVEITFFGNSTEILNLANPTSFTTHTLALIHPDPNAKSIYIASCYVAKRLGLNFNKDKTSVVPITFIATTRSLTPLITYGTAAQILAMLP